MNNISEFSFKIGIPSEVTEQIAEFDSQFDYGQIADTMEQMFCRKTWDEGKDKIKQWLGEDEKGIKILTVMLKCAMKTYDTYLKRGIDEKILIETMKCFQRFIGEHKVSYGTYGFDRDFWTVRQISGNLLRIGELEYEFVDEENGKTISLHIPSDAVFTQERIAASYQQAKELIQKFFEDYASAEVTCNSWLLSPALSKLLPDSSNILAFQKAFVIEKVDWDAKDYLEWVFKNRDIAIEDAPENTTLQRNMKQYILKGGKVGIAFGTKGIL